MHYVCMCVPIVHLCVYMPGQVQLKMKWKINKIKIQNAKSNFDPSEQLAIAWWT